jgi:predicted nucleic acid-binding protein
VGNNNNQILPLTEADREELEGVVQVLANVTKLPVEVVKPHFDALLSQLMKSKQEQPFYKTATALEWITAFREWAESHRRDTPLLSEYALSRAGIYDDDEDEDI